MITETKIKKKEEVKIVDLSMDGSQRANYIKSTKSNT